MDFGSAILYFSYLAALCDCLPHCKIEQKSALMKRREAQLAKKNSWKHVRTTFLGQLRRREGVRNE